MEKLVLFILTILFCGVAEAAQLRCSGEIHGYGYYFRAAVRGTRVVGPIRGAIRGGLLTAPRAIAMRATLSDVRPGLYLRISGTGADGVGHLSAVYDRSSGAYVGTITVYTSGISVSGGVSCWLTGHRWLVDGLNAP